MKRTPATSPLREVEDGVTLEIQVQPRAARDRVVGLLGETLKVQITAAPTDGEANEALVRFLAKTLGCPRSCVEILRGKSSRRKLVFLRGLTPAEAGKTLNLGTELARR